MAESLVGFVVGICWQDIWWSSQDKVLGDDDDEWIDSQFVHYTYGLVLRDTKKFISLTHEWRPERQEHAGTTSIPKGTGVIRSIRVYGHGSETAGEEGTSWSESAAAGRSDAVEQKHGKRPKPERATHAYGSAKKDRAYRQGYRLR